MVVLPGGQKSGLNNEVIVRRGFLYLEPVYPPPVILHSWKSPAALVNEYEGNGDSENVARVKAKNDLVPVYRKELRKVLLEHMPSQLSPKWNPEALVDRNFELASKRSHLQCHA